MRPMIPLLVTLIVMEVFVGGVVAGSDDPFHLAPEARRLFDEAMAFKRAGRRSMALESFMKAYDVDPAVLAHDDDGLLDRAIEDLNSDLLADPSDLGSSLRLCELYALKGMDGQSLRCYQNLASVLEANPYLELARREAYRLKTRLEALEQLRKEAARGAELQAKAALLAMPPVVPPDPQGEQIESLEGENERLREQARALRAQVEELERAQAKLRAEFEAFQEKAKTWKLYSGLFFANPANVQNLKTRYYDSPRSLR